MDIRLRCNFSMNSVLGKLLFKKKMNKNDSHSNKSADSRNINTKYLSFSSFDSK